MILRFHSYWTTCRHVVTPKYNQVVLLYCTQGWHNNTFYSAELPTAGTPCIAHRPASHKHIHNDWGSGLYTTLTASHSAVWKQPNPQFPQQASALQNNSKAMLIVEHLAFPQHTFPLFSSAPSVRQSRSQRSNKKLNVCNCIQCTGFLILNHIAHKRI